MKLPSIPCTTTAQIAAVPFENEVELWLADVLGCRLGGPFNAAVDHNKCGVGYLVVRSYPGGRVATQQFRNGIDVEVIGQVTTILRRLL